MVSNCSCFCNLGVLHGTVFEEVQKVKDHRHFLARGWQTMAHWPSLAQRLFL